MEATRPARRSSWIQAAGVAAVVAAFIAVAVIAAPDTTAARNMINDAGVWVTNDTIPAVGRVNTEINELNSVVPTPVESAELVQSGRWVVSVDRDAGTVTRIEASTARPVGSLALPDSGATLAIVGDELVIAPRLGGALRSVPLETLGVARESSARGIRSDLDLGRDAVVTNTPTGGFFAVSRALGAVLRAELGTPVAEADRVSVDLRAVSGAMQAAATSIGWAILDVESGDLVTPGGVVELGKASGGRAAGMALQETAVLTAAEPDEWTRESVLVATRVELLEVDLRTNRVSVLSGGHDGVPVRPVSVGGCDFAAWSDGSVWQRCAEDESARGSDAGTGSGSAEGSSAGSTAGSGADSTGRVSTLAGMGNAARPVFRTNADRVLLNDPASGQVWAVQSAGALVDNWSDEERDDAAHLADGAADAAEGEDSEDSDDSADPSGPDEVPVAVPTEFARPRVGPGQPAGANTSFSTDASPAGNGSPATVPVPPSVPQPPAAPTPEANDPTPPTPGDGEAGGTMPVPTPVTAGLDARDHTVTLTWRPFGDTGDSPTLGYFAQSLGADAAPPTACAVLSPPSTDVRAPAGGEVRALGLWTTATFSGIAEEGATYGFVVWGYNRAGCVASETVWVTPPVAPGAVTVIDGGMVDLGMEREYRVASVTPAASRYEIQRMDGTGTPVGQIAEFTSVGIVPRTLTGGAFGEVYTFQLRACNALADGGACGPWITKAAPEPSLTFALKDLAYSPTTGTWTWAAMPDNGAAPMKVRCGSYSGQFVGYKFTSTSCTGDAAAPTGDAFLRFTSGVSSRQFDSK
ncbi:hypothetical protein B0I08_105104 [Glaciihabitans tibetensis]|uniref:Fibronectin type-III domain-containing protein n=1 Tax=Glaciihabitans tibetensis TaxID=1266600 RepID=A0A2T0VCN9_9MICO|nr:hypothetical protein [Glaciihabitans tibetensis]PRY67943.1 hypothetical protein B0I08_105104 [Glaciihabitans tibetensis]